MENLLANLAALAAQPGNRRVKGVGVDYIAICFALLKAWLAKRSPTAAQVADESRQNLHGVRLYCGLGVNGKGGLHLDQGFETVTATPESDGEKGKKTKVIVYPPSLKNHAKTIMALNELGVEPPAVASGLGFDGETDLFAALPKEVANG